jgi:2-keto-3-deoxy-L-arabinonate dehydratase
VLAGVVPIAPTQCGRTVTSTDSQSRVLDCMIDHGVDGICIMVDYSEQFLLLDDERNTARPVHR